MGMSRRTFIKAVGGAGLALIGVGGTFAASRTPNRALLPWGELDDVPPADVRLDAFRHAILAPNPHNRQPWLIRLTGQDQAEIFCDLDRRLPQTDPLRPSDPYWFWLFSGDCADRGGATWRHHRRSRPFRKGFHPNGSTSAPSPAYALRRVMPWQRIPCSPPSRTGVRTRRHSTPHDR